MILDTSDTSPLQITVMVQIGDVVIPSADTGVACIMLPPSKACMEGDDS